jgi:hypothetical protein
MGTTQKNMMQHPVMKFMQGIRQSIVDKTKKKEEPGHKGFFRSMDYIAPAEFYNHKSGSFARNQRAQRKLGMKRRCA